MFAFSPLSSPSRSSLLRTGRARRAPARNSAGAGRPRAQRRGGRAGTTRGPHRSGDSRSWRQCGRCRRRGRLRARGDLSARRQYRRRRLHGDPSRQGQRDIAIDYRETAPAAASSTMFLDAQGNADPAKSRDSALSVGVPGTVAGLAMAHEKYGSGKFTLADLIAPAIDLAQKGFLVEDDTRRHAAARARAARALAGDANRFSSMATGRCMARRTAAPVRPRRHVASDCEGRPARILPGPHRRPDCRRRREGRRHHDQRRSGKLSRRSSAPVVRGTLSRLRHRSPCRRPHRAACI